MKHKVLKKLLLSMMVVICCVACQTTKQQQLAKDYTQLFEDKINSFIGKTPNDLYLVMGKPNEYTTDLNTNKTITGAHIIYEKVYNFHKQQHDCVLTFNTNKEQTIITSVKYNSDKCIYLSQY